MLCPLNLLCFIVFSHGDSAANISLCSTGPPPSKAGVGQEITTQKINDLSHSLLLMSPGHNKSRWLSLKKHKPALKKIEIPKPQRWREGKGERRPQGVPINHTQTKLVQMFAHFSHSRGWEKRPVGINGETVSAVTQTSLCSRQSPSSHTLSVSSGWGWHISSISGSWFHDLPTFIAHWLFSLVWGLLSVWHKARPTKLEPRSFALSLLLISKD